MPFDAVRNYMQVVQIGYETDLNTDPAVAVTAEAVTVGGLGVVTDSLNNPIIAPGSVVVTSNTAQVVEDDGYGVMTGDVVADGTINYLTGAMSFTFVDLGASTSATADYVYLDVADTCLYLTEPTDMSETPEFVDESLVRSQLSPMRRQQSFWAGEGSFNLAMRIEDVTLTEDLIGQNGLLLEEFFGARQFKAASTVAVVTSTTQVTLGAAGADNRRVGDLIFFKNNTDDAVHTAILTSVNEATEVVQFTPAIAGMTTSWIVLACTNWRFNAPNNEPATLWVNVFDGAAIWRQFGGQRANQVEFGFPLGELITCSVGMKGAGNSGVIQEATCPFTPPNYSPDDINPLIGMGVEFVLNGSRAIDCKYLSATITISSDIETANVIDCGRTISRSFRGPHTIEGTVEEFVLDDDQLNALRSTNTGSLIVRAGDSLKNYAAVAVPRIRYTEVGFEDEQVEKKYTIAFNGEPPALGGAIVDTAMLCFAVAKFS